MLIVLDSAGPEPLYRQIADQMRTAILAGTIRPGDPLPSIRHLAAELVTSVITTKRAYQELEALGLIQTRQGRGTFVADLPDRRIHDLRLYEVDCQLRDLVRQALKLGVDPDQLLQLFRKAVSEEDKRSE